MSRFCEQECFKQIVYWDKYYLDKQVWLDKNNLIEHVSLVNIAWMNSFTLKNTFLLALLWHTGLVSQILLRQTG